MIACLSFPYFAATVERRHDSALQPKPLAIGGQSWEAKPVYAFSEEPARVGVKVGMSLRLVGVLSPQAHFMPATQAKYIATSGEIIDLLTDFTPLIEPQELWHSFTDAQARLTAHGRLLPARYCLDLDGLPAKEALPFTQEIGRTVRTETQLPPAIGLADNKFTAEIAATVCRQSRILPVADPAKFLAERPISFLPLDKEPARRLRLLGIRTLGQLTALPLAAVRNQFGTGMTRFYHLAQGQAAEPVQSQTAVPPATAVHQFDDPIANNQVLAAVLQRLTQQLSHQLQTAVYATRQLTLTLTLPDDAEAVYALTPRHPLATPDQLLAASLDLLNQHRFDCGLLGLQLTASDLQPQQAVQLTLFGKTAVSTSDTLANLSRKYKTSHFYRPILTDTHHPLPERRFALQRYDPALA